ncbi:MAG: ATP-binding cassette domain-containing protein [Elusimicrobiota bacterium]
MQLKNISYSYKELFSFKRKNIFKDLNLKFEENKIYLITAPNGYGKTTLLKIMAGFLIPDKGDVIVNNHLLKNFNPRLVYIVYNYTRRFYWQLTVKENIDFFSGIYHFSYNLNDFEMASDTLMMDRQFINKKFGQLSNGNMMKANLLLCFLSKSKIWLLDEPFVLLDEKSSECLSKILKEEKKQRTIIIASASLKEKEIADEIVYLEKL